MISPPFARRNEKVRNPDPRKETTAAEPKFLRVVNLKELPIAAEIRCWADDRATVFLNGRRLFRTTYPEDPKSADVRTMLNLGDNFIALEARNNVGAAGILFELNLLMPDKSTVTITGDEQWLTTLEPPEDWRTAPPKADVWKKAMLLGTGLIDPWDFVNW